MLAEFLLAFPALFSIVNPLSGAFIFYGVTSTLTHSDRARLARRVAVYALIVMLVALWAGSYVLAFVGVTLAALRCAGGLAVAASAWDLLNRPEVREARKQEQASEAQGRGAIGGDDIAFYPLTLPFTTGPGTIAVAIALSSGRPRAHDALLAFFLGASGAAIMMAAVIWGSYHAADRLVRLVGPSGSKTVTRLSAFLLLCVGVQIFLTGITDVLEPLLAGRPAP